MADKNLAADIPANLAQTAAIFPLLGDFARWTWGVGDNRLGTGPAEMAIVGGCIAHMTVMSNM
jgi:hypothetical protein